MWKPYNKAKLRTKLNRLINVCTFNKDTGYVDKLALWFWLKEQIYKHWYIGKDTDNAYHWQLVKINIKI